MVKDYAPHNLNWSKVGASPQNHGNSRDLSKSPITVSIITQFYPPDYAATGQLIEELAVQLSQQGMRVHVFTGQPGYAFNQEAAPAVERSEFRLIKRSRTSQLWPQRIRGKAVNGLLFCLRSAFHLLKASGRGDVLLLTTAPPFLPIIGYLANLLFGLPYVCLLYDLYPDIAVELNVIQPNHWLAKAWRSLNKRIWRRADALIVLSSTMKDRVVAHCPEVTDKISVIHNWSNPEWIVPIPKRRNWFALKHDLVTPFTVLYSGNMGRCHDMDTIMEAAEQLKDQPIVFVFIGGGAKRKICMERAQALGLQNCRFLPYQEKQSLPHSLTACDLSLLSVSVGMEGLVAPSKFYPSLAAGRPVAAICEQHSYLRQIISHARCGASFDNGDSKALAEFIRFLAADHKLAAQMGNAGRSYLLSHFTPELIAQQYADVLRQAASEIVVTGVPRRA